MHRAHRVGCPRCRFSMLLDLADQDETVRCRACGGTFVLPVVDESGRREPDLSYRLDGLMARAMDQDVLPALLTLRALRPPPESPELFFAGAGIEFADDREATEVDILISNGTVVQCFEVKDNAAGLKEPQLRKLLRLAERLGARPGIAAIARGNPCDRRHRGCRKHQRPRWVRRCCFRVKGARDERVPRRQGERYVRLRVVMAL